MRRRINQCISSMHRSAPSVLNCQEPYPNYQRKSSDRCTSPKKIWYHIEVKNDPDATHPLGTRTSGFNRERGKSTGFEILYSVHSTSCTASRPEYYDRHDYDQFTECMKRWPEITPSSLWVILFTTSRRVKLPSRTIVLNGLRSISFLWRLSGILLLLPITTTIFVYML
ncbi:hypothetical protein BDV30DRAFT_213730, partial [Aspergillus minisclerotigenes]